MQKCECKPTIVNVKSGTFMQFMFIRKAKDKVVNRNLGSLDDVWNRTIEHCSSRKARVRKK